MKVKAPAAVAVLVALLGPGVARADPVDGYVREQMRRHRIPGLSLAVVKEGKVIRAKGYGLANVEHQVPAKPETVYQSASLSKQFTAAAVLLLAEEGKLCLDAPLGTYLDDTPAAWKAVTVRHLLTHTSGIKDYTRKDVNLREDHTEADLLKKFAAFPMDFAPGSNWRYSNTGYVLLGMLIRKASGEHHGQFLRRRILEPLGMDATRVISEADIVPNRAAGYRLLKRQLKNQEWVAPSLNTLADGCLYTTVLDLAKWDAALYTEKLLKKSSLEQMWAPARTTDGKRRPWGFGWKLGEVRGRPLLEHRGTWQGFRAHLVRYPKDRLTVIVLANLATAGAERVAKGVAGLVLPELAPPTPKPLDDPEPRVAALLRNVLRRIADGTLAPDLFTAEARKEFFPTEAEDWHEILANVGPLASLVLVERKVETGKPLRPHVPSAGQLVATRSGSDRPHRRCRYLADFGEVGVHIDLTLTRKNKIAGLELYQY
jgi:CubicO group peptidase (beta-lactamase class C family)